MTRATNGIGQAGHNAAANIRRLREGQQLTYVELARRLAALGRPVPVLGLRRIEHGERRVDVDDLVAFAQALHVPLADLLADAPACHVCQGSPAPGFRCTTCGAVSDSPPTPAQGDADQIAAGPPASSRPPTRPAS